MDRQKALEAALAQIDRAFGKGSAMKLGSREKMEIETTSTGSLGLDIALGVGGLPRGRVIEIYGPESSGKTTLALHAIAEAQKTGGTAAFVDAEHALDPAYAKKLGVDIDELIVSQPDTGEQALEIVDTLVRSNAVDVLVIDSVAALVPRAEIEGEMGDSHVGLQARLMSQALRKLTGSISRSRCTVIFINQVRMKIGVMYGNPETTTGGNALKFYAIVRLDIRRTGQIKDRDDIVGNTTRVKVVKNKVAPPFKQVEFDIMYGEGVSKVGEILDLGVKAGLVEKSGAWFSYDSVRIGQGRENAKVYLKENPDVAQRIENAIRGRTEEVGEALMVGAERRRTTELVASRIPSGAAVPPALVAAAGDALAEILGNAAIEPRRLRGDRLAIGANSRLGSVRTISRKPPAAHSAVPTEEGHRRPVELLADGEADERRADRADHALDRRGGAGDRRHMLHRQRAEVRRGEGEAGHGQRLEDDEARAVSRSRRARPPHERAVTTHEAPARALMADAPQAESPDDARVEPRRERHRRGDRREHQSDEAAARGTRRTRSAGSRRCRRPARRR